MGGVLVHVPERCFGNFSQPPRDAGFVSRILVERFDTPRLPSVPTHAPFLLSSDIATHSLLPNC